ncbi:TetR family transcriptional regulator [Mycobacterium sp. MS1601]|uniref:TetR/AcrR family transcriptional regulator n=1 Tax=Mycobacterium sp. MS1601 TaxID=1936029 RepID=UPI0009797CCD|nr:TetR/AcrR family transcriptional regulator [Mycobacterium sp. MS1601]AQA03844.1 TetR family transcriptional regulator [Mycobacterium sp. MS1601]
MKVNARRTQAERTAATRAALLQAARNLFATKGFADVSTQAIVEAAGVTRGALYHQFADKAELFTAVYEELEAELVAAVGAGIAEAAPAGIVDAMRLGARLFLDLCSEPAAQQIVLVDAPTVLGWQQWRAMGAKYGLGVIEAMLSQAVAEGAIPEQPLRAGAHVLLGALDEAALYVAAAADQRAAKHEMYAVCDRIILGLAAPR